MSSFNSLSPELLIKIFGYLRDVPTKIRLERVSRRFRDCISNGESWIYNTRLGIGPNDQVDKDALRSYLNHTKEITFLSLKNCGKLEPIVMATLIEFTNKLKLLHLLYDNKKHCSENHLFVACLLGMFGPGKKLVFKCCYNQNCDTLRTVIELLPKCTHLEHVTISRVHDKDDEEEDPVIQDPASVLQSLANLPLKSIKFDIAEAYVDVNELAAVFNTANGHSLHSLTFNATHGSLEGILTFPILNMQFVHLLELAAVNALTTLKLVKVGCLLNVLPTLPASLPNLSLLAVFYYIDCDEEHPTQYAKNVAEAVASFLQSYMDRPITLCLKIGYEHCPCYKEKEPRKWRAMCYMPLCNEFGKDLWDAITPLDVERSGTKRNGGMQEMLQWECTLSMGMALVKIDVE